MTRYKFIVHNPGDLSLARGNSMIADYLKEVEPDFVDINEADVTQRNILHRRGYRTRYAVNGPGTRILVGVRDDHHIVNTSVMPMTETWRGPKVVTRREPRVVPVVTWMAHHKDKAKAELHTSMAVHFAFDGPDGVNSKSWQEQQRRLQRRWNLQVDLLRFRHLEMLGDFNASHGTVEEEFAKMRDHHVLDDNLAVDHFIASKSLDLVNGHRLADVPAHPPYVWVVES